MSRRKSTAPADLPQLEQDPSTHLGRTTVCEGSGRRAYDAPGVLSWSDEFRQEEAT